jgi:hypothetical protein
MVRASLHAHGHLKENSAANVIAVMKEAGFADPAKVGRWKDWSAAWRTIRR